MRVIIFISILFAIAFVSCHSTDNDHTASFVQKTDTIPVSAGNYNSDTLVLADTGTYCTIDSVIQNGDSTFIDADYIQYLTGDAAIEAASKDHRADTAITADGKVVIGVVDDYYIKNESKKIRRLLLAKNCSIDLIINPDGLPPITDNSLASLKKKIDSEIFMLTFNNSGVVIKIKQIFLP